MSEQQRFWRDCADAQAHLNLRCSQKRYVPNSLDPVHMYYQPRSTLGLWQNVTSSCTSWLNFIHIDLHSKPDKTTFHIIKHIILHLKTVTDSQFNMQTIPKKDYFVNFYTVNSCLSKYFRDCKSKERLYIPALKQNKT